MSVKRTKSGAENIKDIEEWCEIITRYQGSGLQQKQFCEQEGIRFGTFKNWLYRIKAEGLKDCEESTPLFTKLMVEKEAPVSMGQGGVESPLILEIEHKSRIIVSSGFGSQTLRRLIAVVRGDDV